MQTLLDRDTFCAKCGYNLRGQIELRCPECGEAFDPAVAMEPVRRTDWFLVIVPGLLAALLLPLVMETGTRLAHRLPDAFRNAVPPFQPVGNYGPDLLECLVVAGLCFLLGAVFGVVLLIGATEKTHLTVREVAFTSALLCGMSAAAVLIMAVINVVAVVALVYTGITFSLRLFLLIALCVIAPFSLGEWAATWVRGRRFTRHG